MPLCVSLVMKKSMHPVYTLLVVGAVWGFFEVTLGLGGLLRFAPLPVVVMVAGTISVYCYCDGYGHAGDWFGVVGALF